MEELEQKLIKLKEAEKQNFYKLYEISFKAHFKGNEEDVDIYRDYIDNRQNIIDEIDKIDTLFNETLELSDIKKYNEIDEIQKEISTLVNKIIEIDKKNNNIMSKVSKDISNEIVKTAKQVNVNNKYTTFGTIGSVFFDSRN